MVLNSIRKNCKPLILLVCALFTSNVYGQNLAALDKHELVDFEKTPYLAELDQTFAGLSSLLAKTVLNVKNMRLTQEDGEWDSDVQMKFAYARAFLEGFKSDETFPSAMNCTTNLEDSIYILNDTKNEWRDNNETATSDKIFDTTYWISYNLGPSSRYCFEVGIQTWWWYASKQLAYDGFISGFLAWLQNLLGGAITFNALYRKIKEADEAENVREMYFWYGRLTTLIVNFDPIPEDNLEFDRLEEDELTELMSGIGFAALMIPQAAQALAGKPRTFNSAINNFSDKLEDMKVGSPRVSGTWDDMYGFSAGLMQSSFGDASPNSTVCATNLTRIVDQSIIFVEQLRIHTNVSLDGAAKSFENMLGSLYPITFACYHSLFEYIEVAELYGDTMTDGLQLVYNFIHKLSLIYDDIYFLTIHHRNTPFKPKEGEEGEEDEEVEAVVVDPNLSEEELAELEVTELTEYELAKEEWWFKLGIYYGTLVYLVLYPDDSYEGYSLTDDEWNLDNNDFDGAADNL